MNTLEIGEGKRFDSVNDYIDRSIEEIEDVMQSLTATQDIGSDELNGVFLSLWEN